MYHSSRGVGQLLVFVTFFFIIIPADRAAMKEYLKTLPPPTYGPRPIYDDRPAMTAWRKTCITAIEDAKKANPEGWAEEMWERRHAPDNLCKAWEEMEYSREFAARRYVQSGAAEYHRKLQEAYEANKRDYAAERIAAAMTAQFDTFAAAENRADCDDRCQLTDIRTDTNRYMIADAWYRDYLDKKVLAGEITQQERTRLLNENREAWEQYDGTDSEKLKVQVNKEDYYKVDWTMYHSPGPLK